MERLVRGVLYQSCKEPNPNNPCEGCAADKIFPEELCLLLGECKGVVWIESEGYAPNTETTQTREILLRQGISNQLKTMDLMTLQQVSNYVEFIQARIKELNHLIIKEKPHEL